MRTTVKAAGLATAAVTAFGLVGAGVGAATPAHHQAHHKVHYAKTPTLKVTVTTGGTQDKPTYSYSINRKSLRAGLVKVALTAKGASGAQIELISFHKGYSKKDAFADYGTFASSQDPQTGAYSKAGLKALNRFYNNSTTYGGPNAEAPGKTQTDVLDLDKTAKVFVLNDEVNGLPPVIGTLKVTGKAADRKPVKFGGVITAHTNKHDQSRFGGDKTLPHKGYIAFKNPASGTTPHFLDFGHVKNGTTKKQVLNYLESPAAQNGTPASFALKGEIDTDAVSPGYAQDVHVNLPKGEYVALCFEADRKTGMPHAFMGMIGIYHLK